MGTTPTSTPTIFEWKTQKYYLVINQKIKIIMEKNRRDELVKKFTHRRDGSVVEFVTVPLEVGKAVKFTRIGEPQMFNNNEWTPVESTTGERISMSKLMYARGLAFNSNKIEDRVDALIAAIERPEGLTLKPKKIEDQPVVIDGVQQLNADGSPSTSKRYTFSGELVG